jgi:hypothetical protein
MHSGRCWSTLFSEQLPYNSKQFLGIMIATNFVVMQNVLHPGISSQFFMAVDINSSP